MHQPLVTDGGVCGDHLSEVGAQRSDRVERLVVDKGACQVDLGEKREVLEELDEEARLDRGARGEVQAQQVVTFLLSGNRTRSQNWTRFDFRIKLDKTSKLVQKEEKQL